jgi:hypothetical protein
MLSRPPNQNRSTSNFYWSVTIEYLYRKNSLNLIYRFDRSRTMTLKRNECWRNANTRSTRATLKFVANARKWPNSDREDFKLILKYIYIYIYSYNKQSQMRLEFFIIQLCVWAKIIVFVLLFRNFKVHSTVIIRKVCFDSTSFRIIRLTFWSYSS